MLLGLSSEDLEKIDYWRKANTEGINYTKIENITVEDLFGDKYLIKEGDFCGND